MINVDCRIFILPLLFSYLFLVSCAQNSNINSTLTSSPNFSIFSLLTESFFGDEDEISIEVIKNIPYASALINFGKSSKSLIILESKKKNIYSWVSSDKKVFLTEDGRIKGTIGLTNDLVKVVRPDVSFKKILNNQNPDPYFAYFSYKKPDLNNLKVKIITEVIGGQKISILGQEKDVILVEEKLESKIVYWKATNRYWVDPQSFYVWKSQQNISPKLPEITLEVTKKPAI